MHLLKWFIPFFILVASVLMLTAFLEWTDMPYPLVPVVIGVFWFAAFSKKWWGWANISILGFVSLAFIRVDLQSHFMFFALLSAVIAWDLIELYRFMDQSPNQPKIRNILWKHGSILGVVIILSTVIYYSPQLIDYELSFGWVLLVGLIVVMALTRGVHAARKRLA